MGSRQLREVIATYLRTARGVRCEAEQIVMVAGSQRGLEIATRALLDPGDRVWMEEPGYSFARSLFAMNDITPSTFQQAVLADFIREGHFSRHIRRMWMIYGERRSALIDCLRSELGKLAEVTGGPTGLHLSLIPDGIADRDIAARASRHNLSLTPLSPSYAGPGAVETPGARLKPFEAGAI